MLYQAKIQLYVADEEALPDAKAVGHFLREAIREREKAIIQADLPEGLSAEDDEGGMIQLQPTLGNPPLVVERIRG